MPEAKAIWEHTCIAGGLFLLRIQQKHASQCVDACFYVFKRRISGENTKQKIGCVIR